jgi:hypothetical protein
MRTALLVIAAIIAIGFTVLNWQALAAPMTLSLGIDTVQAPLGVVMLVALGLLALLFAAWAMMMLAESHRQARELHAQRELADKAEASRFTELRSFIADELQRMTREARTAFEQNSNAVTAHLAEIEDRVERARVARAEAARGDDARLLPPGR